jgi:hypothetical protein
LILPNCAIIGLDRGLHDTLERGRITADLDLVVVRGDWSRSHRRHLEHALRLLKTLQSPLSQRIQYDDLRATTRRTVQLGHHARAVGSRVLPDNKNQIGVIEIFKGAGALSNSYRWRQALTGRFVAIVRAVREVIRSEFSGEQLINEGCFVARSAGGIELHLLGIGQGAEFLSNHSEGPVPFDNYIMICLWVID